MVAAALSKTIDLAIMGTGPQALTPVTHLLQKKPAYAQSLCCSGAIRALILELRRLASTH